MKSRVYVQVIAVVLCGLLASPAFSPLAAAAAPTASGQAALGRVMAKAPATMNGVAIPSEATLFSGDRVATGPAGWARMYLSQGEQVHLAAQSEARASREGDRVDVELLAGRVYLQTKGSGLNVLANGLEIAPGTAEAAVWEVTLVAPNEVLVAAHKGSVEVRGTNRNLEVPAGRSARVTTAAAPKGSAGGAAGGLSGGARAAVIGGIIGGVVGVSATVAATQSQGPPASPNGERR